MGHTVDASEQNVLDWLLKPIDWTQSYRKSALFVAYVSAGSVLFHIFHSRAQHWRGVVCDLDRRADSPGCSAGFQESGLFGATPRSITA